MRLPMPANISEANETGWGESRLNNLAAGLLGTGAGIVKNLTGGDPLSAIADTTSAAKQILGTANSPGKTQITQQLTLNAAASLVKKL